MTANGWATLFVIYLIYLALKYNLFIPEEGDDQ